MVIKQINLYKVGKFHYSFIRETHLENYILNYIVNPEDREYIINFKELCGTMKLSSGMPPEFDWARFLASKIRKYGYTIDVVIEF